MAEDFYVDDYGGGYYNGGGYGGGGPDVFLNGGGGGGYYDFGPVADQAIISDEFFYDPAPGGVVGDDFYFGDTFGATGSGSWTDFSVAPPPLLPDIEPLPVIPFTPDTPFTPIPDFPPFEEFEYFALPPPPAGDDLFLDYLSYYVGQGYDDETALTLADQGAATGVAAPIVFETFREHVPEPVQLPDIGPLLTIPFFTPFTPWETPPIIPPIEFGLPPPPPGPRLPPACPGGTYHPYPIGHPQQDICVPFPPATPSQQRPRPPGPTQPPAQAPRPPAQQQRPPSAQQPCPTGQWRNPQTGRCELIPRCTTPGTVFDQRTGRCVPAAQASQLPPPEGDVLAELKELPWWVWLVVGGGALLALSGDRRR